MQGEQTTSIGSRSSQRRFIIASTVCVLLVSLISSGIVLAYQMRLQKQTDELTDQVNRGIRALVEPIGEAGSTNTYEVPVTTRGYFETPVYAKVPGYQKKLFVDKGDRVRKGK
jgi:multidrug efflux pump subunit AcrA (membrane-fusion protein)